MHEAEGKFKIGTFNVILSSILIFTSSVGPDVGARGRSDEGTYIINTANPLLSCLKCKYKNVIFLSMASVLSYIIFR